MLTAAFAAASTPADSDKAAGSSFALTPSVWSAGFEGVIDRRRVKLINASIELDTEFFIPENLDTVGIFSFAAQAGRWSFLADSLYVDHSSSIDSALLSPRSGNTPNLIIEGTLGYQIPNFEHIELIAGGRYFSFEEPHSLALPHSGENTESWADAFIGTRIKYDFSKRWYASLRADIGGLNTHVDDRYSVAAFVGYRLNEITTLELGYRQLSAETQDSVESLPMQGVGLGLGIRF